MDCETKVILINHTPKVWAVAVRGHWCWRAGIKALGVEQKRIRSLDDVAVNAFSSHHCFDTGGWTTGRISKKPTKIWCTYAQSSLAEQVKGIQLIQDHPPRKQPLKWKRRKRRRIKYKHYTVTSLQYEPRDRLGRTYPKWPNVCWAGWKTVIQLTYSTNKRDRVTTTYHQRRHRYWWWRGVEYGCSHDWSLPTLV